MVTCAQWMDVPTGALDKETMNATIAVTTNGIDCNRHGFPNYETTPRPPHFKGDVVHEKATARPLVYQQAVPGQLDIGVVLPTWRSVETRLVILQVVARLRVTLADHCVSCGEARTNLVNQLRQNVLHVKQAQTDLVNQLRQNVLHVKPLNLHVGTMFEAQLTRENKDRCECHRLGQSKRNLSDQALRVENCIGQSAQRPLPANQKSQPMWHEVLRVWQDLRDGLDCLLAGL